MQKNVFSGVVKVLDKIGDANSFRLYIVGGQRRDSRKDTVRDESHPITDDGDIVSEMAMMGGCSVKVRRVEKETTVQIRRTTLTHDPLPPPLIINPVHNQRLRFNGR